MPTDDQETGSPTHPPREVTIPSSMSGVHRVMDLIADECRQRGLAESDRVAIETALTEAITNAVRHGNQEQRERAVRVEFAVHQERFEAVVHDEGTGFRPEEVPDPAADENLTRPSGRGVKMIRHLMDQVDFSETGSSVSMKRILGKPNRSPNGSDHR